MRRRSRSGSWPCDSPRLILHALVQSEEPDTVGALNASVCPLPPAHRVNGRLGRPSWPSTPRGGRGPTTALGSSLIVISGEVGVDGTEADGGAVHGHRSGDQPVSGAGDSRSCARRVSHVADLGTVGPSPRR